MILSRLARWGNCYAGGWFVEMLDQERKPTSWVRVDDSHLGSEAGDELVAAVGGFGGGAADGCWERGKKQQATLGERGLPCGRDTVAVKAAGGADDDGDVPRKRMARHSFSTGV